MVEGCVCCAFSVGGSGGAVLRGGEASVGRVIVGDCVDEMAKMPEASVDAVVCDPPYG